MKAARSLIALALLAAATAALSCGEPAAPSVPQASLVTSLPKNAPKLAKVLKNMHLVRCAPMAAAATATIGSSGGSIQVGPHTLDIPAGALRDPVTITAFAPSDTVDRIQFQPEGLTFRKSVYLTMSFASCDVDDEDALWMVYTDDALNILEVVPTARSGQQVVGKLDHFSNYALSW